MADERKRENWGEDKKANGERRGEERRGEKRGDYRQPIVQKSARSLPASLL